MELHNEIRLHVAIRADGNSKIGLGHIIRTMVLGNELKKNNCKVTYITQEYKETLDILKKNKFEVFNIKTNASAADEIYTINKFMKDNEIDIFIGDSFKIDKNYIAKIKKYDKFVVIIDNLRDMSLNADLIINGGIYAYKLAKDAERYKQKVLLGTKYFLIREQFANINKKFIKKEVKSILITMGGADPMNLTPKIIKMVSSINRNLKINVVVGNAFKNIKEIKDIDKNNSQIYLNYNVENMAELMYESNIAISAGGTTLYELAIVGTPSIVLIQAENQVLQSNIFNDEGIVLNLGYGDKVIELCFKQAFVKLINDYNKRKEMFKSGREILDSKGAKRCVEKILMMHREYNE